ncbi:hypothetical protein P3342_009609 [Pyrenophora teres f. teres]|nr:hypothetical protein P3342_009609 [Pyrenophora teres f. teres]
MPPKVPLNWGLLPPSFLVPSSARYLLQQNASSQICRPAIAYTSIRTIKSTFTPKPDRFAHHPSKPALESTSTAALERRAHSTPSAQDCSQ